MYVKIGETHQMEEDNTYKTLKIKSRKIPNVIYFFSKLILEKYAYKTPPFLIFDTLFNISQIIFRKKDKTI